MTVLIESLVTAIAKQLNNKSWSIATAESCTGGGIGQALTAMSGSSTWYEYGFITYSNEAKQRLLNVPTETLETYGAVSEQTVKAMAEGALIQANANIAIAVSGVAGPSGGTKMKPVGTVYIGLALLKDGRNVCIAKHCLFQGSRDAVRQQTIAAALELVKDSLN